MKTVISSRRVFTSASAFLSSSGAAPFSTASSNAVTATPNTFSNRRVSSVGISATSVQTVQAVQAIQSVNIQGQANRPNRLEQFERFERLELCQPSRPNSVSLLSGTNPFAS